MSNTLLVYLDGTSEFEVALYFAVQLMAKRAGKIVLSTAPKAFKGGRTEAELYLEHLAAKLRLRHISVSIALLSDDLVPSILSAASLHDARAIVVSDNLGLHAKVRLLNAAQIPVIRIHSTQPSRLPMFTKPILVVLDGTSLAESALPYAVDMARSANVPLILLDVVPSLRDTLYTNALTAGQPWSLTADQMLEEQEEGILQDAHQYLVDLRRKWEGSDWKKVLIRVEHGNAVQHIVQCAQVNDAGLIVIAKHPDNLLYQLAALGVSDQVMRCTNRPVLVVAVPWNQPHHRHDPVTLAIPR